MEHIRIEITNIFSKGVQEPLSDKSESFVEYTLYWLLYDKFHPLRRLVSRIPYK